MSIFFELFITFFKIGLFTFGGGYAMLPLIQEEVLAHKWMEVEEIINFIAVSESTPGPFSPLVRRGDNIQSGLQFQGCMLQLAKGRRHFINSHGRRTCLPSSSFREISAASTALGFSPLSSCSIRK